MEPRLRAPSYTATRRDQPALYSATSAPIVSSADSRTVIRLALFLPGGRELRRAEVPGEWIENPRGGSFADALSFGTVEPPIVDKIDAAPGALLVQLTDDLREGRERVVAVVEALRERGALAVRLEQSKLGWAIDRWLALVRSGDPWALHRCAVTMLVGDGRVVSCGMHAFSLPDAFVRMDAMTSGEAQELLSALNVYQLAEDPLLLSGQTFSPDAGSPRRVVQRWPDDGYPPDHWCHNPYGVWRLSAAGAQARPQTELHPLLMPALVLLLQTLEEKAGPLTRRQVEETTKKATCVAVEHRHAQEIKRTPGYADNDPDLAWEQWCVVRANRDRTSS
jgi:hypothetical protein